MNIVTSHENRNIEHHTAPENGKGQMTLEHLLSTAEKGPKVRTYARACLKPGAAVGYHVHHGESETYYILSGKGEYNDNGKVMPIKEGDVTYTGDGCGHGIENTGDCDLEFIALIVLA